jgi:hypothetical protein
MTSFPRTRLSAAPAANGQDAPEREPLIAPFRVVADFREAVDGWQFTSLPDREQPGRCWTVPVEYRYLETADYTVEELSLFIVRRVAADFLAELEHWPESIAHQHAELHELEADGAACLIVIEGDAEAIARILSRSDPAPHRPLHSVLPAYHGIPWLMADSRRTAELMTFEIMRRAWARVWPHQSPGSE